MAATTTLANQNRDYWNTHAADVYKQEWVQALAVQITKFLQTNIEWIGMKPDAQETSVRMLDYACGTGVASRALFSQATSIIGIDVSEKMVAMYNETALEQGATEVQMRAVQGNLVGSADDAHEELNGAAYHNFDLIVMSMALHHMESPQKTLAKLTERLRAGGVLIVIDWAGGRSEDMQPSGRQNKNDEERARLEYQQPSAEHTMTRTCFKREEMEDMLKEAGCNQVEYVLHPEMSELPPKFGGKRQLFFARGQK